MADATEFDTDYTAETVCPWCGEANGDSWELDGENGEQECGSCERPFRWSRTTTVYYSTEKVPDPTPDEARFLALIAAPAPADALSIDGEPEELTDAASSCWDKGWLTHLYGRPGGGVYAISDEGRSALARHQRASA